MIQLLFNVSSSQEQHWITAALWWLLHEGKKIWKENENKDRVKNLINNFKEFLEKLDRAFAIKRLQEGVNENSLVGIVNEYLKKSKIEVESEKDSIKDNIREKLNVKLNGGTSTPHYWFYKLDYLLWRDFDWSKLAGNENIKEKDDDKGFKYSKVKSSYRLSKLNSIEHIYPQSKADKDPNWKDCKDIFGNLALISNYMNSKLWNQEFPKKREIIQEQLNNGTIESLKMLLVYSKYREWTPQKCKEHHNEMIDILATDLASY